MEQILSFFEAYFLYIWFILLLFVVSRFYFTGKSAMKEFGTVDSSKIVFSDKYASGYSTKSWRTKRGGASKTLQILIADEELILKSFLFFAGIAKRHDLLHRIPFKNITDSELHQSKFSSKLFVRFNSGEGEKKEVVLMSSSNERIKKLLDARMG